MQLRTPEALIPDLPCACATLRRAARAVSQLYAEEFEGLVETPQYSLLANLNRQPDISQAALGRILVLDKTTLSRNLAVLKKKGWIKSTGTAERRERTFELTPTGLSLLHRAQPAWQRAQDRLRDALGDPAWKHLFGIVNSATRAASEVCKVSKKGTTRS